MSQFQNIISSKTTTPKIIEEFTYQHTSLQKLTQLLIYAQHILQTQQSLPCCKNNIVYFLLNLVKKCHYPCLLIVQNIFLPLLWEPARVAAYGDPTEIYDYFKNPEYQAQSYHFTTNSLLLYSLLASIKPKKLYRTRQLNSLSKAKKMLNNLIQNEDAKNQNYEKLILSQSNNFSGLRRLFFTNLNVFNKNSHAYIDFFIQQMEIYVSKCQTTLSFVWFKKIAIQGDHYLSSQSLFRLSQIIISHSSFNARKRCFQIFSQFLQNGSLLAHIILNFTENFMKLFLQIEKMRGGKTQATFFPEIEGQNSQKQVFVNMLMCKLKSWALLSSNILKQYCRTCYSPIYQLYNHFRQLGILFPPEIRSKQTTSIQKHFQQQSQYNKLMLSQLQKVLIDEESSFNPSHPNLQSLTIYYQKHKLLYEYLVSFEIFLLPSQFNDLLSFKHNFTVYINGLSLQNPQKHLFDILVKEGEQLFSKIDTLQEIYNVQTSQRTFQTKQLDRQFVKNPLDQSNKGIYKLVTPIVLTKDCQQLQKKLYAKMKYLASNRSLVLWEVSSLQINSRPYLAYNLHSKQITENLLPIVRLDPLRSTKRLKAGIKLLEKPERLSIQQKLQNHLMTPRFRSVLNQNSQLASKEQRKKLGLKLTKNKKKYIRYISYLRKRQAIPYYTNQRIVILNNSKMSIQRSQLVLSNNKLIIKYCCQCDENSRLFSYKIIEQPSIHLQSRICLLSAHLCQIIIEGKFAKFGYNLPTISFYFQSKPICEVSLPFAFNNFLKISSPKQNLDFSSYLSSCQSSLLDMQKFRNLTQVNKYFRGAQIKEDILQGYVEFYSWQCIFQIHLNNQRFTVTAFTNEPSNNVLFEFLPLFIVQMLGHAPTQTKKV